MVAGLTARDREVLAELESACRNHLNIGASEWVRPLDCGGTNGSDHSWRLSKLVRLGLAEDRQRSISGRRGSKVYRITEPGRNTLSHTTNQRTPR